MVKSDLAKIIFCIQPLAIISTVLVHPTLSMALVAILLNGIPLVLCWGFDSDIAKWEFEDRNADGNPI